MERLPCPHIKIFLSKISHETQITYEALVIGSVPRQNLTISMKSLIILSNIIGSINVSVYVATISPAFSSKFTSLYQFSESAATNSSGGPSSGYEQAREDPSYAVIIPFTDVGASQFEPHTISIPANMTAIWFNEDDSPHSVTANASNTTVQAAEQFHSDLIDPDGGFFIHKFAVPGIYDYYDSVNPQSKGRINVGSGFEPGQNMDMLVGGNALPFEAGKIGRTTFSFVPHDNVTTIPPTLSITYSVTIADSNGTTLYSNNYDDSDGILDLELIPSMRSLSSSNQTSSNQTSSSNQTTPNFVSWGPDLTDQEGVASDGVFHVQGPVMTENEDYTINVAITSIDNAAPPQPASDDFLLPSVNSTAVNSTAILSLQEVGTER